MQQLIYRGIEIAFLDEAVRRTMTRQFKVGDHVSWNSEAGRVRGTITKKVTSVTDFKGYKHHATRNEPQYFIQSDKTDHVALHKGTALRKTGQRMKKKK